MVAGRSLRPLLLLVAAFLLPASALTDSGAKGGPGRTAIPNQRRRLLENDNCPDPYCFECDSAGRCTECLFGYGFTNGKCVKCADPLCEQCGPSNKCTACTAYTEDQLHPVYLSTNGRCLKCVNNPTSSGCDECDSAGRCTACGDAWTLRNGKCIQCVEGCIECDPATKTCSLCEMRKGLDANKQCRDCAGRRARDRRPICLTCDDDYRICTVCDEGYYADAKGVCVLLPDGCKAANVNGCTRCEDDLYLTPQKTCAACDVDCSRCTSLTVCTKCNPGFILTPAKTCQSCGFDCEACTLASPGRTRCTKCTSTTLIDGECRRCEDPRCAECPGDVRRCKVCRNKAYVVNSATGRCQDPSWPPPCPQTANGSGGRQGKCGATPQKPTRGGSTTGRRLQADAESGSIARRKLIVGGRNATQGRYPYLVSLRHSTIPTNPHFCAGALVHERVVLTAAHCLLNKLVWHEEGLVFSRVRIGGYELEGGRFENRHVKWAVVHPGADYVRGHTVNDFALLLLDRPSTTRPLLRLPAALPRPAAAVGTPLTAMGWGVAGYKYNSQGDPIEFLPPVLQETTLQMQSLKLCASRFAREEKWDAQFCVGQPGGGTNTCQGDSGGPVIARSSSSPDGDLAVGIVSWGLSCESAYGVNADMAAGSQWIRNATQWLLFEDAAGRIPGPATGPA